MADQQPRPDGFDYSKPDPETTRCWECNQDGMNRTGFTPIPYAYVGASTTIMYARRCPSQCAFGLTTK